MRHAFAILFAFLAGTGIAYYLLSIYSAINFLRMRGKSRPQTAPASSPISLLKPVHGIDREAYENLRSHCLLDYPDYEIIFGVNDAGDAAIPLIQQLMREFPERRMELIVCPAILGTNRKVSNLIQMLPAARHDFLLINDGDIRVPTNYLRSVMARFISEKVGLVSCLYHGNPALTLGSELEALGISTDFTAGVLVAQQLEGGIRFGLGSTLALRRKMLKRIGKFETLVDYLADDYEMGRQIAAAGYEIALADVNVETYLPPYSLAEFFHHQLRWARGIRDSRRWGYTGLIFSFGLPWAIIAALLAHGAAWSLYLLGAAIVMRAVMAIVLGGAVLHDRSLWRDLWLIPLRDVIGLGVWAASFTGNKVSWRGKSFILKDGKLKPVS